jgi:hypothetical protein
MRLNMRPCQTEDDYWRVRNFLCKVFLLNGHLAGGCGRGLGKAVMLEGLRRLQHLGCTRVFSIANEEPADALYRSVMTDMKVTDTWVKEFKPERENK